MSQSQNQHQDHGMAGRDVKGGLNGQSGVKLDMEGMEVVLEQSGVVLGWLLAGTGAGEVYLCWLGGVGDWCRWAC